MAIGASQQIVFDHNLPQANTALDANGSDLRGVRFNEVVGNQVVLAARRPRVATVVGGGLVNRDVGVPDLSLRIRLAAILDKQVAGHDALSAVGNP